MEHIHAVRVTEQAPAHWRPAEARALDAACVAGCAATTYSEVEHDPDTEIHMGPGIRGAGSRGAVLDEQVISDPQMAMGDMIADPEWLIRTARCSHRTLSQSERRRSIPRLSSALCRGRNRAGDRTERLRRGDRYQRRSLASRTPQEARGSPSRRLSGPNGCGNALEALRVATTKLVAAEHYGTWRQTLALPALQARDEAAAALMSAYETFVADLLAGYCGPPRSPTKK